MQNTLILSRQYCTYFAQLAVAGDQRLYDNQNSKQNTIAKHLRNSDSSWAIYPINHVLVIVLYPVSSSELL
jgi:hypothetical protein